MVRVDLRPIWGGWAAPASSESLTGDCRHALAKLFAEVLAAISS